MTHSPHLPGVPMSLQHDAWWLEDDPAPAPRTTMRHRGPVLALLVLLVLADLLFWHQTPGLSLAIFALAVFAATLNGRLRTVAVGVLILSVLPVVEYVQTLSLGCLLLGLPTAIALNRGLSPLSALPGLLRRLPLAGITDLTHGLRALPRLPARSLWRNWAFPVGGTLILVSLLAEANPVLSDWIAGATNLPLDPVDLLERGFFWVGLGLILWPVLADAPNSAVTLPQMRLPGMGLNAASVTNALILFNALLALQTVLDARYLWAGAAPAGMTLAAYAHRGAYPLLATALLAGGFALAARPWLAERAFLRPLLLLWLAQNVLLTLSALYRLDLYVGSFGLTYLRAHAAFWMGLVAVGLALTAAQIALGRSNRWLLIRCTVLGVGVLYLCAFINFAGLIARVNLAEGKMDAYYLCNLGPTAAAELATAPYWVTSHCSYGPPQITGWRDWGFRNWRVLRYLEAQPKGEGAVENSARG